MPLAMVLLQGCSIQQGIQNFIDTHAESICSTMEEGASAELQNKALAQIEASGVCASMGVEAEKCKNCASNGLQEVRSKYDKQFIENCAKACKNLTGDPSGV